MCGALSDYKIINVLIRHKCVTVSGSLTLMPVVLESSPIKAELKLGSSHNNPNSINVNKENSTLIKAKISHSDLLL